LTISKAAYEKTEKRILKPTLKTPNSNDVIFFHFCLPLNMEYLKYTKKRNPGKK